MVHVADLARAICGCENGDGRSIIDYICYYILRSVARPCNFFDFHFRKTGHKIIIFRQYSLTNKWYS